MYVSVRIVFNEHKLWYHYCILAYKNLTCYPFITLVPPKINRDDIPQTTVKVGQPIKFYVHIKGEPPPDVVWIQEGKGPRSSDKSMTIDNEPYLSKFLVPKAERQHAGKWKIKANNAHGEDIAEVEICVLGKPSKPMGPLDVKDIK